MEKEKIERCKYCNHEATFHTLDTGDIINGKTCSFFGYWLEDRDSVCIKFQTIDEQFKDKTGFFYCRCPEKCSYYQKENEVKQ